MRGREEIAHKINSRIFAKSIRIVGSDGFDGVYNRNEALQLATTEGTDLIQMSETNGQAICKLMEYKKFLYQQKQKEKEKKQKQKSQELKEIRLSPDISSNDVAYRIKNAIEFLKEGSRVKLSLQFKGRQINHKEKGELVLLSFAESVAEFGILENMPKLEGKKMFSVLKPKNKS